MIIDVIQENAFNTPLPHIAYAINTEGIHDTGFAQEVAEYCPAIEDIGQNELGSAVSISAGEKKLHALVCYERGRGGWEQTPIAVSECLKNMQAPADQPVALVLMGAGLQYRLKGADVFATMKAIHQSPRKCILYTTNYSKREIENAVGAAIGT